MKRTWIVGAWLLSFIPSSFAFDFGGVPLSPKQPASLRWMGLLTPNAAVQGAPEKSSLLRGDLTATIPVYRGTDRIVTVTPRAHLLDLTPDTPRYQELYDLSFTAAYTRFLSGGRFYAITGTYGSASDQPFRNSSVAVMGATALYSFPGSPGSNWTVLLNYSNNRPFLNNIPLPGFAYTWIPSKTFRGTFGLPFGSISWDFAEHWNWTGFALLPWVARTQLTHVLNVATKVYAGGDFSQSTYLEYGRADRKERLFYDEKKLFLGIEQLLTKQWSIGLDGGYAFGRRFFHARNYELKPSNATHLASTWFGRLGVTVTF